MDVSEVFEQGVIKSSVIGCAALEVTGWLVVIDYELCVIRDDYLEPFESNERVRLSNSDIAYAVRDSISPLGGGSSFVFHRVKVVGCFYARGNTFEVESMLLEIESGKYVSLDLSAASVAQAKKKYPGLMERSGTNSRDWIDYFL
ncbi:hypothetical protein [Pseudomonas corrugata]|uniref:hypothetical protein n=1 Tax=Pseudomonas corrugata TaxID=47879 RepID=UPI002233F47B|nr:hypothetical protein [Pseudomonas corrugata]UZE07763.1 hypothetical protein LOY65_07540 [Pseudomonas corrugata]